MGGLLGLPANSTAGVIPTGRLVAEILRGTGTPRRFFTIRRRAHAHGRSRNPEGLPSLERAEGFAVKAQMLRLFLHELSSGGDRKVDPLGRWMRRPPQDKVFTPPETRLRAGNRCQPNPRPRPIPVLRKRSERPLSAKSGSRQRELQPVLGGKSGRDRSSRGLLKRRLKCRNVEPQPPGQAVVTISRLLV